jgi:hypothetical protein
MANKSLNKKIDGTYPNKTKSLKVIIIIFSILLFLCMFCCAITYILSEISPPMIELLDKRGTTWISDTPTVTIRLNCINTKELSLNGEVLDNKVMEDWCGGRGPELILQDGDNVFTFIAKNGGVKEVAELTISITFDKSAYDAKVADELAAEAVRKAAEDQAAAEAKANAEAEALKPKKGDVISGISIREIKAEYDKQKELSDARATLYLESLQGQTVVWVGEVYNVDNYIFDNGFYIWLNMSSDSILEIFNFNLSAAVDIKEEDILKYQNGQILKVSGTISRVDEDFLGLTTYIKNAQIEIVE